MTRRLQQVALLASLMGLAFASVSNASAGDEKALIGSYALTQRVTADGKSQKGPEVVGFMTFTKTRRTVIMKWIGTDGTPASIAFIANYTLSGGKYCEGVAYGVQSNLGAPGVSYDAPSESNACSSAISDASGLAFDVPGEKLRLRVGRDGIIATTPGWTDNWKKE